MGFERVLGNWKILVTLVCLFGKALGRIEIELGVFVLGSGILGVFLVILNALQGLQKVFSIFSEVFSWVSYCFLAFLGC